MKHWRPSGVGAVLGWSRVSIRSRPVRSTFLLERNPLSWTAAFYFCCLLVVVVK